MFYIGSSELFDDESLTSFSDEDEAVCTNLDLVDLLALLLWFDYYFFKNFVHISNLISQLNKSVKIIKWYTNNITIELLLCYKNHLHPQKVSCLLSQLCWCFKLVRMKLNENVIYISLEKFLKYFFWDWFLRNLLYFEKILWCCLCFYWSHVNLELSNV